MASEEEQSTIEVELDAFQDLLNTFIWKRERTIQLLKKKVKQLNSCRERGNISKIVGAGMGVGGVIATVASVPLTGGLSLVAAIGSVIVSAAGAAAGFGGDQYVKNREKKLTNQVEEILDDDFTETSNLKEAAAALRAHVENMSRLGIAVESASDKSIPAVTLKMARHARRGLSVITALPKLGKLARLGTFCKLIKIAKIGSAVTAVVFVPIEIIQIVKSSSELFQGNSERAKTVQNAIDDLERDLVEKKELATTL